MKYSRLDSVSVSFGFFMLVMMICLVVALTSACAEYIDATYKYEERFTQTIAVKEPGSFSISNINGSVTIFSSPVMEVTINATKYARWRKEDLDRVRIEVISGEKSVLVETIHEKRNLQVKVDYEITVPENMALELIRTVNGRLLLNGKFARASLRTTNGSISGSFRTEWLEAVTGNGNIELKQIRGKCNLRTTNGSIKLELDEVSDDLEARTTNGSIEIRVKSQPDGYFSAATTNGSIRVEFPVMVEGQLKRRRLEGKMGSGQGPRIELRTTNGSISLLKL